MTVRGKRQPAATSSSTTVGWLISNAVRALTGASDSPLLDAQLLLAYVIGAPRSSIIAFPERPVRAALADEFDRLLERRRRGEPLAYLVRSQEFYSLPLRVTQAVLIPRPETELLVDAALELLPRGEPRAVLDVGTGSGAIALAIKHERPAASVTALDVSAAALAVARANAERLGIDVRFVESNWFTAVEDRCQTPRVSDTGFDVIVCNPPYVQSDDRAFAALEYEPRLALDGGADGLDALRAVLAGAAGHLNAGGRLLLEHGHDQRAALVELAQSAGWCPAVQRDDLAGRARVLELEANA
ncbi:MAG TPA: peptide chain release factor N(5)-glutamine methyltransferase [Gammaproteobacteria bacterium]|nr:peptide chain release factor N(5)-glutamine methyltransferase [Gammaproteobacteria bacterium]